MKDTLYRIEPIMRIENPELRGSVMINCNGGVLFAELHPVNIKAKTKAKPAAETREPCEFCECENNLITKAVKTPDGEKVKTVWARYCFYCGRRLPRATEDCNP